MKPIPFKRPAPLDDSQLDKMMVKSYRDERMRRKRTVDDDFRNDLLRLQERPGHGLKPGEFSLANVSMFEPIEELAFNKLGGVRVKLDSNYFCKHCGMEFGMAIPPQICPRCHTPTYFGELVKYGAFRR